MCALPGYLRWRLAGSPLHTEAGTVERWHHAFDSIDPPRRPRVRIGVAVDTGGPVSQDLVDSLRGQTFRPVDVVIVGDEAPTLPEGYRRLPAGTPLHVAAASVDGDRVVLVTAPVVLSPTALAWLATPRADLIYGDEEVRDATDPHPLFKPAWSPRMLLGHDLAGAVFAVSQDALRRVSTLDGATSAEQALDLLLRLSETPLSVAHMPSMMARRHAATGTPQSLAPVASALRRRGVAARVLPGGHESRRVVFDPVDEAPAVKVVMPTRDHPELLGTAVSGVLDKTEHVPLHLVIVDDGTRDPEALRILDGLEGDRRVTVLRIDEPFNYSRLVNRGVEAGPDTPLLLLLNNDIEMLHPDWLLQLTGWLRDPAVVAAGPKLLFPDGTIQHAGMVFGLGGIVGHLGLSEPDSARPGGLPDAAREVSCLTAACLLVKTSAFHAVGGMDESFRIDFQDVDLCLRLRREIGGTLMYDPTYPLVHVQMGTRDPAEAGGEATIRLMRSKWGGVLSEPDPYYNPHLTLDPSASLAPIPGVHADRVARLRPRLVDHPGLGRSL